MAVTRGDLLASVRRRHHRTCLTTADRFLRSIESCLDGCACPGGMGNELTDRDWQQELKEAESKFVYCAETAPIIDGSRGQSEMALTDGAILDFEAIVTTTRRDRDGDVLEAAGADVDPAAVLLWQHIPFQPIGRMIGVTQHTSQLVKARLSIADTELGRDAATLAKFGAVKISHGFEPLVFEPFPDSGWHIQRFEIFEISLVSVPSNRDAVITAFSRRKLNSPFIREWARTLFRERPVQANGANLRGGCTETRGDGASGGQSPTGRRGMHETQAPTNEAESQATHSPMRDACRQFVARTALADACDLDALHQTLDALEKVIECLESA